jgi:hypothetical protein
VAEHRQRDPSYTGRRAVRCPARGSADREGRDEQAGLHRTDAQHSPACSASDEQALRPAVLHELPPRRTLHRELSSVPRLRPCARPSWIQNEPSDPFPLRHSASRLGMWTTLTKRSPWPMRPPTRLHSIRRRSSRSRVPLTAFGIFGAFDSVNTLVEDVDSELRYLAKDASGQGLHSLANAKLFQWRMHMLRVRLY